MTDLEEKKLNGRFFTITNPFYHNAFFDWINKIPVKKRQKAIEPFAGSNNIIKMLYDLGFDDIEWFSYDIKEPTYNCFPDVKIKIQDTIKNFPKVNDCYLAITNPPYLAKNSATRSNINFEYPEYDDLYKKCLEVMLKNCEYVAAIIPESFITSNTFFERVNRIISLNCKMFDDTDCPVCLAMFSPIEENDLKRGFDIYSSSSYKSLGKYNVIKEKNNIHDNKFIKWNFNDPKGNIGIICIDNNVCPSINFCLGNTIKKNKVKVSSRSITRVSGLPKDVNLNKFLNICNEVLKRYREGCSDIFLTSFKGLRKDNKYRRRLDFTTARAILSTSLEIYYD